MVSISFGIALVAGRTRVPRPATGNTALRIFMGLIEYLGTSVKEAMHLASSFAAANKGGCRAPPPRSREKSRHQNFTFVKLLATVTGPPEGGFSAGQVGYDAIGGSAGKTCWIRN